MSHLNANRKLLCPIFTATCIQHPQFNINLTHFLCDGLHSIRKENQTLDLITFLMANNSLKEDNNSAWPCSVVSVWGVV